MGLRQFQLADAQRTLSRLTGIAVACAVRRAAAATAAGSQQCNYCERGQ